MDRISLATASLLLSTVSLIALFHFYQCPAYDPSEFEERAGECITVKGYVVDSHSTGKVCIYKILLSSQEYVKVVDFDSGACRKGYICIEGRIQMWQGAPEVVVLRYC